LVVQASRLLALLGESHPSTLRASQARNVIAGEIFSG